MCVYVVISDVAFSMGCPGLPFNLMDPVNVSKTNPWGVPENKPSMTLCCPFGKIDAQIQIYCLACFHHSQQASVLGIRN